MHPIFARNRLAIVAIIFGADGPAICSFAVTPSAKVGKKVTFDVTCNNIGDSKVYIIAYQVKDDDQCTIEATGRLATP